jgi:D-apionate oxidoisomerase
MTTIALIGAGGKMGYRLSRNLKNSDFRTHHVEVNSEAAERLERELGVSCVDMDAALQDADAVILAVPDVAIARVAATIEAKIRPNTMLVILDAAAPFAGHLPKRPDLTFFVTHPCHPSVFNHEPDAEARRDYFGGISAKQGIVCALMQGPEDAWQLGEKIARCIYAPVDKSFRVSVEQMALLEPVLSETVCGTLLTILREATDECVARGVPEDAAREFVLGHANIMLAVLFDEIPGRFSDGCNKAIEDARPVLINPDWKRVFEPEAVAESIRRIT